MRAEIQRFAGAMEKALQENDHKGGWKNESVNFLTVEAECHLKCLEMQARRLIQDGAYEPVETTAELKAKILDDAADVANFALMVADICEAL